MIYFFFIVYLAIRFSELETWFGFDTLLPRLLHHFLLYFASAGNGLHLSGCRLPGANVGSLCRLRCSELAEGTGRSRAGCRNFAEHSLCDNIEVLAITEIYKMLWCLEEVAILKLHWKMLFYAYYYTITLVRSKIWLLFVLAFSRLFYAYLLCIFNLWKLGAAFFSKRKLTVCCNISRYGTTTLAGPWGNPSSSRGLNFSCFGILESGAENFVNARSVRITKRRYNKI